MLQQLTYINKTLPDNIKTQILSYLKELWPEGFQGENINRTRITKDSLHPTYFVLTEKDQLISFASVIWMDLVHGNIRYKMYSLSGVFTLPQFRNQGYGLQLINLIKQFIETSDADIVLFPTKTRGFYEKAGFLRMENVSILYGDKNQPRQSDEMTYMLFLSKKGKKTKQILSMNRYISEKTCGKRSYRFAPG